MPYMMMPIVRPRTQEAREIEASQAPAVTTTNGETYTACLI